ncbi:MAG: helix-turn-helix transcriptional regulator [Lachnospiraceae bacterium]|nr:helix-turn-helix transcriptional regulator [Lachnospiraceae bacterium]
MKNKLRELRGDNKLADTAAKIGISLQYLSKIEKGQRTPSLKIASKLSNYYDIPIEELFPNIIGGEINVKNT